MNIEQLNQRVAKEQYEYDKIVRRRALVITAETIARMDEYMIGQKARLDKAIEERQDLIDNPERRYLQPGTRLHPEKIEYTDCYTNCFPVASPMWTWP